MTIAVCLHCGQFKHGAFVPCLNCGHTPESDEDLTRHLFATDHYQTVEVLEHIATRIKAGETVGFDPHALKEVWVNAAELKAGDKRMRRGCLAVALGIMTIVIAMIVAYRLPL